jgi:hypothetical protein
MHGHEHLLAHVVRDIRAPGDPRHQSVDARGVPHDEVVERPGVPPLEGAHHRVVRAVLRAGVPRPVQPVRRNAGVAGSHDSIILGGKGGRPLTG